MAIFCLLSPAKTIRDDDFTVASNKRNDQLICEEESKNLVRICSSLSKTNLAALLKVSDSITSLNYDRYKNFDKQKDHRAVFMYDGPAYKGLQVESMNNAQLDYLNSSLIIITGLYGILRPFDIVKPYRLDMGLKVKNDHGNNLYDFWKVKGLTNKLLELLDTRSKKEKSKNNIVLNCASNEYSKSIDLKELTAKGYTVINCEFKAAHGERMGMFHAKQARGAMAGFIARTNAQNIEEVCKFTGVENKFKYCPAQSSDQTLTFLRYKEPISPKKEKVLIKSSNVSKKKKTPKQDNPNSNSKHQAEKENKNIKVKNEEKNQKQTNTPVKRDKKNDKDSEKKKPKKVAKLEETENIGTRRSTRLR